MRYNKNGLFSLRPMITPLILIACVIAGYYYIDTHYLFTDWLFTIYVAMKILVALFIVAASARTLLMPVAAFFTGVIFLVLIENYGINIISVVSAWQLIIVSAVGFIVSLLTLL